MHSGYLKLFIVRGISLALNVKINNQLVPPQVSKWMDQNLITQKWDWDPHTRSFGVPQHYLKEPTTINGAETRTLLSIIPPQPTIPTLWSLLLFILFFLIIKFINNQERFIFYPHPTFE